MSNTKVSNIVNTFVDAKPGFVSQKTSFVTGVVSDIISEKNSNPIFFRIQDQTGFSTLLVRHILEPNETPESVPTKLFKSLKVGDLVELWGIIRKTKKNKIMMDAMGIGIKCLDMYDSDEKEYESESESDYSDDDEDYLPDSDEEYQEEEYESDSDEEVLETRLVITDDVTIDHNNVFFHGVKHEISGFNASPGSVELKTEVGSFIFNDMRKGYLSVSIDPTPYEPEYKTGYVILMKFNFHKILDILI